MKIENLSLADIKAAIDFIKSDLHEMEQKASEKGIEADQIPSYSEVKATENRLYQELLNRTRLL